MSRGMRAFHFARRFKYGDFLDRLATQLKVGKGASCRRAIQRVLELVKKDYEASGHSPTEAEREFRRLVENE